MFKVAKKVSGGYNIPLKEPLKFTLSLFCPFGIDVESNWKWSMKFYVPIRPDSLRTGTELQTGRSLTDPEVDATVGDEI